MDTKHIDLIALAGVPLKKTANTNGGEYHGACPFCGGDDRFWIAPNDKSGKPKWYCRSCEPRGGDAVSFIMKRDNLPFKAACEVLGLELQNPTYRNSETRPNRDPVVKNTDRQKPALSQDWQQGAASFALRSWSNLHSTRGTQGMDYLLGRGLAPSVIATACLGYNPTDYHALWGGLEVFLPAGIVIPWYVGQYTTLRVRRLTVGANQAKYAQTKGMIQGLYQPVSLMRSIPLYPHSIVVLVEGELDALAIQTALYLYRQAGHELPHILPLALGSITNGRTLANVMELSLAKQVLIALDADGKAETEIAALWWQGQIGTTAKRLFPTAKDPGDMLLKSSLEIGEWLLGAVA